MLCLKRDIHIVTVESVAICLLIKNSHQLKSVAVKKLSINVFNSRRNINLTI